VDRAVKLTITHEIDRPESRLITAVSGGWPRILSNLKSLIETGGSPSRPIPDTTKTHSKPAAPPPDSQPLVP
jgi:hypothetical protein